MPSSRHPIQPLITDSDGDLRFKPNAIVQHLLDKIPDGLGYLAREDFSDEDREQFAQLIGYEINLFCELDYVSDETYTIAKAVADGVDERDTRIAVLESTLDAVRDGMRKIVPELFPIHEDDLKGW